MNDRDLQNPSRMLQTLITGYGVPAASLAPVLGMTAEAVEAVREGNDFALPEDEDARFSILCKLGMLCLVPNENPDAKVGAFLHVLLNLHKLSPAGVARLAGLTEGELSAFLSAPESLPLEKRYRLASAVMTLRFLFKDAEPPI